MHFQIASAQVPDAGALQQQLQREVEQNQRQAVPENFLKKPEAAPSKVPAGKQTILVKEFIFTGITLITQEQAQSAVKNFVNRQLTFAQIQEAGNAVTELYSKMGRVATAIVPPQEVKNGVIQIKILEGKVGSVIIDSGSGVDVSRLKPEIAKGFIAYGNPEGQLVNTDNLERSLSLINELPGIAAEGGMSPGTADGTTNINVNVKDTSLFNGRVEVSNYGSPSTGVAQAVGNLNLNNALGIGDLGTLDVIGSEGSVYGTAKYWIPVGYDGFRVGLGASALNYTGLSSFSSTSSNGSATTVGAYSSYALERNASATKTVVVNFENRAYQNYSAGVQSSQYTINSVTAGLNGNNTFGDTTANWGAMALYGNLNISNAQQLATDQSALGAQTAGGYGKLNAYVTVTTPLPIEKTNLQLSANGQLANRNLNSADQIYMGGPYAVRAYPVAQGGGSQGAIASVEINHQLPSKVQIGAFFDAGLVQQYVQNWNSTLQGNTNAGNTYALYSTGLTGKYNVDNFQLQGALAFRIGNNPLYNSSGQQLNVDNQYRTVQLWIKGTYLFK